jgi:O-antigen/teichoic acid export membrane protein
MFKSAINNRQPKDPLGRTERAWLTSLNEFLQNGASTLIALLVTPYIAKKLGFEQYGVWLMVVQILGYVTWADLNPGSALKLALITRQNEEDHEPKRRIISASLIVALANLPIYIVGWLILYWCMPLVLKSSIEWVSSARLAMTIMLLDGFLTNFFSVFSNILRAMNSAFRAMGRRSFVLIVFGMAQVVVVGFGLGMPGLAILGVFSNMATTILLFDAARKSFSWLGLSRPNKQDVLGLLKFSPSLFLSYFGYTLFQSSDLLVIGWILDPTVAAVYGLTKALPLLADRWLRPLVLSATAGLGDLYGRKEIERLAEVRTELHMIVLFLASIFGALALVLNKSFVELWVGHEQFAGLITSTLLILGVVLSLLSINDMILLDICGYLGLRVVWYTLCGLVVVICGALASIYYGVAGMVCGVVLGHILLLLGVQVMVFRLILDTDFFVRYCMAIVRPLILVGVIYIMAFVAGSEFLFSSWLRFVLAAGLVGLLAAGIMWFVGFTSKQRGALQIRLLPPLKTFIGRAV